MGLKKDFFRSLFSPGSCEEGIIYESIKMRRASTPLPPLFSPIMTRVRALEQRSDRLVSCPLPSGVSDVPAEDYRRYQPPKPTLEGFHSKWSPSNDCRRPSRLSRGSPQL